MDYSFLVVTYNSEDTIIATLESIRYQIERYSEGYDVQLVLCDDGSKDNTVKCIEAWLNYYGEIFSTVTRIYNKDNIGTCKNIVTGYKALESEFFRDMAGDDILPKCNSFAQMNLLKEYDVVRTYLLSFENGKLRKSFNDNFIRLAKKYDSDREIRFKIYYDCPMYNGTLMRKSLLTDEILDYIEKFQLVEDRPMWYKIVKNNPSLSIYFCEEPAVLYRDEGQGVTDNNSPHKKVIISDCMKLYRDIYNETENPFLKYVIWCEWFNKGLPIKYINPITYYKHFRKKNLKKKVMIEEFRDMFEQNQKHLDYILLKAEKFYGEMKNASN